MGHELPTTPNPSFKTWIMRCRFRLIHHIYFPFSDLEIQATPSFSKP